LGCSEWPDCSFKSNRHSPVCPSVASVKRRISAPVPVSPLPPTFHGRSCVRPARARVKNPDTDGYTWHSNGVQKGKSYWKCAVEGCKGKKNRDLNTLEEQVTKAHSDPACIEGAPSLEHLLNLRWGGGGGGVYMKGRGEGKNKNKTNVN
jgi:hypothetical protein